MGEASDSGRPPISADAAFADAEAADAEALDAAAPDAAAADAEAPDAAAPDAEALDAAAPDAEAPDVGPDAGVADAGADDAALLDAGADDATAGDAAALDAEAADGAPDATPVDVGFPDSGIFPRDIGVWVATSSEAPAAQIVRTGTTGLLLRGVVLAPEGPIDPGEVLVVGNTITCVASDCSTAAGAQGATLVETRGVISPGLLDGHNHLAYDFLPEWAPIPFTFWMNRYQWANDAMYEAFVAPYSNHRATGTHFCPAAKWGELRALVHGTTTIQGQSFEQSCIDRLLSSTLGS